MTLARYDGFADWYGEHLADFNQRRTPLLLELLGAGPGRCLEIGCGGGVHVPALVESGWSVVGVDLSADQLRVARRRVGPDQLLVLGDAARLPFADQSFDAVAMAFIHTDVDDWRAVVNEAIRVLRSEGRLAYAATHPCFVGPFSKYPGAEPPILHPGYRDTAWTTEGPGLGDGLRRRVGVRHVPLADLLNGLLDAGLHLERVEEPGPEDFPRILVVAGTKLSQLRPFS